MTMLLGAGIFPVCEILFPCTKVLFPELERGAIKHTTLLSTHWGAACIPTILRSLNTLAQSFHSEVAGQAEGTPGKVIGPVEGYPWKGHQRLVQTLLKQTLIYKILKPIIVKRNKK